MSFSFDMKVPTAQREGKAEVYVCAYFLFSDQRSHRQFWLGPSLFDPRGSQYYPDIVHVNNWEAGTGLPILFTARTSGARGCIPDLARRSSPIARSIIIATLIFASASRSFVPRFSP